MLNISGYRILERINEGKSSTIYRAIDNNNQKIILKVIDHNDKNQTQINKIQNEYENLKSITSSKVIKTYGLKKIQDKVILILEDFNAISLKTFIKNNFPIDIKTFLKISIKICESLEEIHKKNIIHGDIKPDNILINVENMLIKITDFGFSFTSNSNNKRFIDTLEKENIKYISPEQSGRMNQKIDIRTDFYSLGIILYEILISKTPFESDDVMEIIHQHIAKKPISPYKINSEIPETISNIVMKLLEKNVNERYKSDYGLIYDLKYCLENIINNIPLSNINIGKYDINQDFIISEKIYGKNFALKNLLNILENTDDKKLNIIFITGKEGIGKSYFINYTNTHFIKKITNLIDVKFDKTKINNPYYSLTQSLVKFINNLITQNAPELNDIKKNITNQLNKNLEYLIDLVPELSFLVNKSTIKTDYVSNIDKNNLKKEKDLNNVLKEFFIIFINQEKPLTICLDELEYADSASIKFIMNLLNNEEFKYLNLILLSRNENENLEENSLKKQIMDLSIQLDIKIKDIQLYEFNINEIFMLLNDTFGNKLNNIEYIANIIFNKTQGNPLFVNEFIKSLYEKKIIYFKDSFGWFCDTQKLDNTEITKNVIELILDKISYLPNNILEILKTASCIGIYFSLSLLEKIYDYKEIDLSFALNTGIISLDSHLNSLDENNLIVRFSHNKIHETIYLMIEPENKTILHYKIGKILLNDTKSNEIYEVLNHLNKSIDLVIKNNENIELVKLNFQGAIKSKNSSLYKLALDYIKYSVVLVDNSIWVNDYDLAFNIYNEYAQLEYLNFNFDGCENIISLILEKDINDFDKAKIYQLKSLLCITTNKLKESIYFGVLGLKYLNFHLPTNNLSIISYLVIDFFKVKFLFKKINSEQILLLPEMNDKRFILIMNILIDLMTATYMIDTKLLFLIIHKMILISFKKGNSELSSYSYVSYASFISFVLNETKRGYNLGQTSLKLLEQFNESKNKNRVNFIYANLIHHWYKHDRKDISILKKNIKLSIESGDLLYVGYSILHIVIKMFIYGDPIDDIYEFAKNNSAFIAQAKNNNISEEFLIRTQMILSLKGLTHSYNSLNDNNFNEDKFFYILKKSGNSSRLAHAYTIKMQLNYFFGNYETALEYAEEAKKFISSCYASLMISEFYFFYSLIITSLCIKKPRKYKKNVYLSIVKSNQKKFKKWSDNCPEGFFSRYILIEAELSFIKNKFSKASEYYNLSIELSKKYNFTHYQALANELSAKFYISREHEIIAKDYINEAYLGYVKWGAKVKALEIKTNYAYLFNTKEDNNNIKNIIIENTNTNDFKLDFETVMKASQTLSSEIFLDKLIDKLIKIVVENAGAERGILILKNKNEFFIEAEGNINFEKTLFFQNKKLELSDDLSHSIVNYVERTGNEVVIEDAITDDIFTSDYYISTKKPKSILCIPINKQQNLVGILYLENNLTKGAFTSDRIQVLKLIASQAAISLENARLYDEMRELNISLEQNKNNLEDMVDKRTRQLKITQKRLVDAAHRSGMAEIATGVLHNIGNILNGVNISSQIINETIEKSKVGGLIKANDLLKENMDHIEDFITNDPKGKKLLKYYLSLGDILKNEINDITKENKSLSDKISLMKEVIVTQQNYAKTEFLNEKIDPIVVIEDSISLQAVSLLKSNIKIVKKYTKTKEIEIHKAKMINILINLLKNSEEALEKNTIDKIIKIEVIQYQHKYVNIKISDNGEGILKENINKVFNHGFTTKPNGHGFGLHTCANSMTEMGAKIIVKSDGLDKGATFVLTFPIQD